MIDAEIQRAIEFLQEKLKSGEITITIQGVEYAIFELIENAKLRHSTIISLLETLKEELIEENRREVMTAM